MGYIALPQSNALLRCLLLLCLMCFGSWCKAASSRPDPFGPVRSSSQLSAALADIKLVDQTGAAFNWAQLRGRVVLLNFIFTKCATVCPIQTHQLQKLQQRIIQENPAVPLALVSVSLTPLWDTPDVLSKYAQQYKIPNDNSWRLLTGDVTVVEAMMVALGMKATAGERQHGVKGNLQLSHLTNFYLFDPFGRLKKQYDGTTVASDRLVHDIVRLNHVSQR